MGSGDGKAAQKRAWKWVRIAPDDRIPDPDEPLSESVWLQEAAEYTANVIVVSETAAGEPVLYGTLLVETDANLDIRTPLRFHVTPSRLVTLAGNRQMLERIDELPWRSRLDRCSGGHEAFGAVLCFLAECFHTGLDGYEGRLAPIEEAMRERNRRLLMDRIIERRHELIRWGLLLAPFRELEDAMREAFMDDIAERPEYRRFGLKLDRIESLLNRYEEEIDTLLNIDEAVSSFRGNEIVKTLTIFTAMFTPASVIGALWGMNFKSVPLVEHPAGFAASIAGIVLIMAFIYFWLWRKGWTGDLLNGRDPESHL